MDPTANKAIPIHVQNSYLLWSLQITPFPCGLLVLATFLYLDSFKEPLTETLMSVD